MNEPDNHQHRRYMRVSQKSGCVSADFRLIDNDTDNEIVPYDDSEKSGLFRHMR